MIKELLRIPTPARWTHMLIGILIVIAWGFLFIWQRSPFAELLGHELLGEQHFPISVKLLGFFLSWTLMTVAMMLPANMPTLLHSLRYAGQPAQTFEYLVWIILGYLSPWMVFGLLAFLGDSVLHALTETGSSMVSLSSWIAPTITLAAGLYQFTPIKWRCIQQCQPSYAIHNRMEMSSLKNALSEGTALGVYCVGSCWALMLVVFAIGHQHLVWMLIMSLILAGERLTRYGKILTWLVGSMLLLSVLVWMLAR